MIEKPNINYPPNLQVRVEAVQRLVSERMPRLPYHNPDHALEVAAVAEIFGLKERYSQYILYLLRTVGLVHDLVYVVGAKDNEERTVQSLRDPLIQIGYPPSEIEIVNGGVMATKIPTNPNNPIERIVCDADVDNIGRDDFWEKNEAVRIERGIKDKKEWYVSSYNFLKSHRFHTSVAEKLRGAKFRENLERLRILANG